MKKIMNAKKGGFTLVELLIVMVIVSILAGMMMLTMGSATDRAEATKIISDTETLKSAAIVYALENNNEWPVSDDTWNNVGGGGVEVELTAGAKSLDKYLDKPILRVHKLRFATPPATSDAGGKDLIGLEYLTPIGTGVQEQLKKNKALSGLYDATGKLYNGGNVVMKTLK